MDPLDLGGTMPNQGPGPPALVEPCEPLQKRLQRFKGPFHWPRRRPKRAWCQRCSKGKGNKARYCKVPPQGETLRKLPTSTCTSTSNPPRPVARQQGVDAIPSLPTLLSLCLSHHTDCIHGS